jgi:hypothetical protein
MPLPSEFHVAVMDDSECLITGKVGACSQLKLYTQRRLVRHIVCAVVQAESRWTCFVEVNVAHS